MKIGNLGVGNIGATLTKRLSAAGHDVQVANSRGPETIAADVFASGGRAAHAAEVVRGVDALIVSIPFARIPEIRPLVDDLPTGAVLLDTSNYYPMRDGDITALDQGQVESLWVSEQLGRPVVKAWNAITAQSFNTKSTARGTSGRIAIPVAADSDDARALGLSLVDETGFDGFDAGALADSWRQQPGTPAYCTDLTGNELRAALAVAVPGRAPRRRDLAMSVIVELMSDPETDCGEDFLVRVNRLIYP